MIKLKVNRQQLATLCSFTNPAVFEAKAAFYIKLNEFSGLDMLFNIVQIGETVAKKYFFTNKKMYIINLKLSEASSLLRLTYELELIHDPLSYELNLAIIIRTELHTQITNHQTKFNGQTINTPLVIGANKSFGGTIANLT